MGKLLNIHYNKGWNGLLKEKWGMLNNKLARKIYQLAGIILLLLSIVWVSSAQEPPVPSVINAENITQLQPIQQLDFSQLPPDIKTASGQFVMSADASRLVTASSRAAIARSLLVPNSKPSIYCMQVFLRQRTIVIPRQEGGDVDAACWACVRAAQAPTCVRSFLEHSLEKQATFCNRYSSLNGSLPKCT